MPASNSRTGWLIVAALGVSSAIFAQDTHFPPQGAYIPSVECHIDDQGSFPLRPCTPAELEAWRRDIRHWRTEEFLRIGYDGTQYERSELNWTQSSYIQAQMMVEDRFFYDPERRTYTVDRFLDDLEKRYGGIDAVLIWHVYPNTGIDTRNQYDMLRALPGGIEGVKQMIADAT